MWQKGFIKHLILFSIWSIGNWHVLYSVFYLEPQGSADLPDDKEVEIPPAPAPPFVPEAMGAWISLNSPWINARDAAVFESEISNDSSIISRKYSSNLREKNFKSLDSDQRATIRYSDTIKFHFDHDITSNTFYLRFLFNTSVFIGWIIGSVLVGSVSDRYGRRKGIYLGFGLLISGVLVQIFSGFSEFLGISWIAYGFLLFGRVLVGAAVGGNGVVTYVWGMEWANYDAIKGSEPDTLDTSSNTSVTPTFDEGSEICHDDKSLNSTLSRGNSDYENAKRRSKNASSYVGALFHLAWSIGGLFLSVIAFVIPSWIQMLYFLLLIDCMFLVIVFLNVEESPIWLQKKLGVIEEMDESMSIDEENETACSSKPSDRHFDDETDEGAALLNSRKLTSRQSMRIPKYLSFFSLFRYPYLQVTVPLAILWFANAFSYYGLSLNASHLPGNPYLVSALLNFVSMPGQIASVWIVRKWGSARGVILGLGLGGLMFLVSLVVPYIVPLASTSDNSLKEIHETIQTALSLVAEPFLTLAFTLCYMITSEAYPTIIRNRGVALGALMGRLGAMACPSIVGDSDGKPKIGAFGMALLCIVCWSGALSVIAIWKKIESPQNPAETSKAPQIADRNAEV